jgi:hypothetical protein
VPPARLGSPEVNGKVARMMVMMGYVPGMTLSKNREVAIATAYDFRCM